MANGNSNSGINLWYVVLIAVIIYLIYAYSRKCCPTGITFNPEQKCSKCDPITASVHNFLNSIFRTKPKDAYQQCLDNNKKLSEGSDCTVCVPSESRPNLPDWVQNLVGSTLPIAGVMKDGICVIKTTTTSEPIKGQIQVSNPNGATIYQKDEESQGMKPSNQIIPVGSKLNYVEIVNSTYCAINAQVCYPPKDFYKMTQNQGYILNTDVSITNPTI